MCNEAVRFRLEPPEMEPELPPVGLLLTTGEAWVGFLKTVCLPQREGCVCGPLWGETTDWDGR